MNASPSPWSALSAGPIAESDLSPSLPPQPSARLAAARIFLHNLQALLPRRAYALAVSGGPDSMALLALAAAARELPGAPAFTVLHVHHGLAAEANDWAEQVQRAARRAGLAAHVLRWQGKKPAQGLAALARRARYALLGEACAARRLDGLILAHHMEDQAETVLLRLARGSQWRGLAAMAARRCQDGVWLLRPFLGWRRDELRRWQDSAYGAAADPANHDLRFARPRLRAAAPALRAAGLTPPRLARMAHALGRARAIWDMSVLRARKNLCRQEDCGLWRIDRAGFNALPPEMAQHLLDGLLRPALPRRARDFYPIRTRQIQGLWQALRAARQSGFNLAGFLLRLRAREILLYREPTAVRALPPLRLRAGETSVWDGRFRLAPHASGTIAPLGADGLAQAHALGAHRLPWPQTALMTCPGLWQKGRLQASTLNAPPHDLPHELLT